MHHCVFHKATSLSTGQKSRAEMTTPRHPSANERHSHLKLRHRCWCQTGLISQESPAGPAWVW